jgi:hypothetical protein
MAEEAHSSPLCKPAEICAHLRQLSASSDKHQDESTLLREGVIPLLLGLGYSEETSVDRANPAISRHRKSGHFVAVIETGEFYCEAVS